MKKNIILARSPLEPVSINSASRKYNGLFFFKVKYRVKKESPVELLLLLCVYGVQASTYIYIYVLFNPPF